MTTTVIDGTNLAQITAHAGIVLEEPPAKPEPKGDAKPEAEPKGDAKAQPDAKADAKKADDAADDAADDVEDDDGITDRQRRELSAKMLKAIGKKHRQVKEAEEFAAQQIRERQVAEARAADLDRQVKAMQPKEAARKEEVEPKREDFATETEFFDAKIKWGVDRGIRERDAQRAAEERDQKVRASYARAVELVGDFEQTVSKQMTWPQGVVAYMKDSDLYAEFGYHFGKNPTDLERLVGLSHNPAKQLVELGKIEARLRPFGSQDPKDGKADKADPDSKPNGETAKSPSAVDTGSVPSKARSDAPVITPLTGGEGSADPDARAMTTRQQIEKFQRDRKVNLNARKRH